MVRHLLPSGARFIFNLYFHHWSIVLRRVYGTANILHGREDVKQRDPLAVVAYGIGIILLIKFLESEYPNGTHT